MKIEERNIQNTLVCLIHGIIGRETTIELRNEDKIFGEIESVDEYMSVDVKNAIYIDKLGKQSKYERFYVKGCNIRYVQIPPDVNIIKTIEQELERHRLKETYNDKTSKPKILSEAEKKERRKLLVNEKFEEMKKKLNRL